MSKSRSAACGADAGEVRSTGSLDRTIRVRPDGGRPAPGAPSASGAISLALEDQVVMVLLGGSDHPRDVTPLRPALEATLAELAGSA